MQHYVQQAADVPRGWKALTDAERAGLAQQAAA
jgi:hypothetical protein